MKKIIENTNISEWMEILEKEDFRKSGYSLWKRVRTFASKPKRQRVSVNLYKLDKVVKNGEIAVVPGKVLSIGNITHPFELSAIELSDKAKEKLLEGGCKIVNIDTLAGKKNIRLII